MAFSYKPLWVKLVQEDIGKEEFRLQLGLSSSTLAKMGKNQNVSMETIDKICDFFGCQPNDIMTHVKEPAE